MAILKCSKCLKEIDTTQPMKRVLILTEPNRKGFFDKEMNFHFDCFPKEFNEYKDYKELNQREEAK